MPKIVAITQSKKIAKASHFIWQWNNILLEKHKEVSFSIPTVPSPYQVKLTAWSYKTIPSRYIGIVFTIKGITSILWLSNWPMADILKDYTPEGKIRNVPKQLQVELIETVYEAAINFFELHLDHEIQIQKLIFNQASKSNLYSIRFQLLENNKIITAILVSHAKLAPLFLKGLNRLPSSTNKDWLTHKTLIHYEIASLYLPIKEVRALENSDVIFLEQSLYFQNHILTIRLTSGERYEAVQTSETTLEFQSGEKIMTESSNDQIQEKPIIDINEMPIRLSFDLGEESLTFKEVSKLRPGYILNLKKPFTNVIKIRSQNQLIGKGEIVDIEGRIGVRITQLFSKKD